MSNNVIVGIMDRSTDPPRYQGQFTVDVDSRALLRGAKVARNDLRVAVEAECRKRKLHIEAMNDVHEMPQGIPPCDYVVTVLPEEVSKAFAAKRQKTRPVLRGGKPIQRRRHDVGIKTMKPKEA